MNKIREKLHIPKARSICVSSLGGSLETIVRDSMYLVWPIVTCDNNMDARRRHLSKSYAFDDALEYERYVNILYVYHVLYSQCLFALKMTFNCIQRPPSLCINKAFQHR